MKVFQLISQKGSMLGMEFKNRLKNESFTFITPIGMLFVACLIVANITAQKPIHVFFLTMPGGSLIFPFSYIFANILTEVYGYKWSRFMIWASALCNAVVFLYIKLTIYIPSVDYWVVQNAYDKILGSLPLIFIASTLSYLSGEHVNSYVLAKLKIFMQGKYLWARVIVSTAVGSIVDSLVFIPIVFYKIASCKSMVIMAASLTSFKVGYEILALPLTYFAVYFLRASEGLNVYDFKTKYTPFSLNLYYSEQEKRGIADVVDIKNPSNPY
jgi:uncharacterized integral membrane protein (TIGR00697 family)